RHGTRPPIKRSTQSSQTTSPKACRASTPAGATQTLLARAVTQPVVLVEALVPDPVGVPPGADAPVELVPPLLVLDIPEVEPPPSAGSRQTLSAPHVCPVGHGS